MKKIQIFKLLFLGIVAMLASCIKEEAPNAECDIVAVSSTWLEEHKEIIVGEPTITNRTVSFNVVKDVTLDSLKALEPVFELTPGASVEKGDSVTENGESGVVMYYRTHAEDGVYFKDYEISFTKPAQASSEMLFSFENFNSGDFYTWYEVISGTQYNWWASSNEGYKMTGQAKSPEDFPTSVEKQGFSYNCVRLKTCDTGSLGAGVGMPIAAGSIFIGKFLGENAMSKPLEATRFGLQIAPSKPLTFEGYYKYSAGEVFTDKNKSVVEGRKDSCSIYAVLYEVDPDNVVTLCGTDVTTSNRIVMIAELKDAVESAEWQQFNIPFELKNGKSFDENKLMNNEYAFTVVASSSKNGGFFEGAVGSTLYIDEFKVTWEKQDEASNAECDIIAVNEGWLKEHRYIVIGKPEIGNKTVNFNVVENVSFDDLKNLEPIFELSEGARIEKIGDAVANGANEVIMQYKTYSVDEKWSKDYKVTFTRQATVPFGHVFGFENFALDESGKFYTWYECIRGSHYNWWATGNDGYKMTGKAKKYSDYPTTFDGDGVVGCCVRLKTCDTGIIGKGAGMPIAPGCIYIGEFQSENVMKKPLEATQFGLQIASAKPIALRGYYKYTAGDIYTDKDKNVIENKKDTCAIYAVLYEVNPDKVTKLNGTNVTTSDRILLVAEVKDPGEPADWKDFYVPFKSVDDREFDYEKLMNNEYAIAFVASSSKNGAAFEGAVGSTLYIDEIEIVWEE